MQNKQLSKFVQELPSLPKYDAKGNVIEGEFTERTILWGWFFPKEEFPDMVLDIVCDVNIVTPTISSTWSIKNQSNGVVEPNTIGVNPNSNSIILERGYKVSYSGKWKWQESSGYKNPTRTAGSWGTTLPNSNVESSVHTETDLTANKTITQTIYAKKTGPIVSGNKLLKPTGEDSTSASASVNFRSRYYIGPTTSATPSQDNIKALGSNTLTTTKALTKTGVTASGSEYYCYAYPKDLGALTKITQNGAAPVIEDFNRTEVTVTNNAGLQIVYYVYTSKNKGAFTNVELKFE